MLLLFLSVLSILKEYTTTVLALSFPLVGLLCLPFQSLVIVPGPTPMPVPAIVFPSLLCSLATTSS